MPHELDRLLSLAAGSTWFIDPAKAEALLAVIELRIAAGPEAVAAQGERHAAAAAVRQGDRVVRVVPLQGTILPRGGMMAAMSGAASLDRFQRDFRAAAADPQAAAIVLDIDSPGGQIDLVPETHAMIRSARRADRPIVAAVNTLAASAAYWIASAADRIDVTPSGQVGSIGVYTMHEDVSRRLEAAGIRRTFISEGPRKTEGNPFEPLSSEARGALQASVREAYDQFTRDVARARNRSVTVVRADPEKDAEHFGGGRTYGAREAVRLGMADRVATFDQTMSAALRGDRPARRASIERLRFALDD